MWLAFLLLVLLIVLPRNMEGFDTQEKYMFFPKQCSLQTKAQCNYSRLFDNPRVTCEWNKKSNLCDVSNLIDLSSNVDTSFNYKKDYDTPYESETNETVEPVSSCLTYTNQSLCELKHCEWSSVNKKCGDRPIIQAYY